MKVFLTQAADGDVCLVIGDKNKRRKWLSPDEAQHLANRLQAFAKGQQASYLELIIPRPTAN